MKRAVITLSIFALSFAYSEADVDKFVKASTNIAQQKLQEVSSNTTKPLNQQSTPLQQTAPAQPIAKPKKVSISEATLKAINKIRQSIQICSSKKAPPLIWNKFLYNEAKEHSIDLAVTGLVQHDGSGTETDVTAKKLNLNRGSHFYERVNQKANSREILSGELVVATGNTFYKTPKDILYYWINKPKACKVIMDPRFSDVALSKVISNTTGKAYWTLLLAGRRK